VKIFGYSLEGKKLRRLRDTLTCVAMIAATLPLAACGKRSSSGSPGIEGVNKYDFSYSGGNARLSISFANLKIDTGAVIPLSQPAGASIQLSPDFMSEGTLFVITVPLASLADNHGGLPLLSLPDGRPLPDVVSGSVNGTVVNLPLFGLSYLYMGRDMFGLFLPIQLPNTHAIVRVKMKDEAGNLLGAFYGIPPNGSKSISGLLVLIPVEGSSASRTMKRVLN
jgi:hypothetical protein